MIDTPTASAADSMPIRLSRRDKLLAIGWVSCCGCGGVCISRERLSFLWTEANRISAALGLVLLLVVVFSCTSAPNTASTSTVSLPTRTLLPAPADTGKDALWGYVDGNGKWAIKAQFQGAMRFSEGLAPVEFDGRWGYVNEGGTLVIPPQFAEAHYFKNGLARVATDPPPDPQDHWLVTATGYGFIDRTGQMVIPAKWDDAGEFSEGLAPVMEESACGFIDTTGNVVIPLTFDMVVSFSEGLAPAASDGKWGYIDKTGKWAIEPTYAGSSMPGVPPSSYPLPVGRFQNGIAPIALRVISQSPDGGTSEFTKAQYIDKSGEKAFDQVFDSVGDFSEGLAPVKVGDQWGFIDASGDVVIEPQFGMSIDGIVSGGGGFNQGLAAVSTDAGVGYIDKTGKFIIPPQFSGGGGFSDGFAYVYSERTPLARGAGVPSTLILQVTRGLEIIDLTGRVIYRAPAASGSASTSSS